MSRRGPLSIGISVAVGLAALQARAVPVTFAMEGTVQAISAPPGWPDYAGIGDRAYYEVTFDSETPHLNIPGSWYQGFHGIAGSARVGSTPIAVLNSGFVVQGPADFFRMASTAELDGAPGFIEFNLSGYTGGQLSHLQLLTEPYLLSDFGVAAFTFGFEGPVVPPDPYPRYLIITGEIDSFYVVPEPSSFLAFLITGMALVFRRGR